MVDRFIARALHSLRKFARQSREQVEFAPAHNRFELEAVRTVDRIIGPDVLQVAVFDTGFHKTLEPAAYVYPGPYSWLEDGVRRYGFHGINHQYCAGRAAELLGRDPASLQLIICHLGNGASLAAVRGGKSVDTTMGFTPLEGLMMGTRSGSIDPGILVYLIRHRGYSAEQLDQILNKESGLLGVSGISGDMRKIEEGIASGNARAQLAFDVYIHRLLRSAALLSLRRQVARSPQLSASMNCAQRRYRLRRLCSLDLASVKSMTRRAG